MSDGTACIHGSLPPGTSCVWCACSALHDRVAELEGERDLALAAVRTVERRAIKAEGRIAELEEKNRKLRLRVDVDLEIAGDDDKTIGGLQGRVAELEKMLELRCGQIAGLHGTIATYEAERETCLAGMRAAAEQHQGRIAELETERDAALASERKSIRDLVDGSRENARLRAALLEAAHFARGVGHGEHPLVRRWFSVLEQQQTTEPKQCLCWQCDRIVTRGEWCDECHANACRSDSGSQCQGDMDAERKG